ncbi:alpha-D-QuiNAc alpha-1,3-galactosyltransferase [endosymbiont of Acanthamoeba sp. UWC8]|uniref:glycosyltransferase family 4 protein n=1 Tax=endosymbiont of Acanthamoeba sp. UWC8 TaxID=86106 RepID=UPI0004D1BDFA|nr:glycosyltransferase family 4 protein [endosymbiont of Acanthamoeba sp. UWC8]AIF81294.1 alpha-D-QuiNAc alpha-1,3-galactosyltransferase [endosymbiont of Acanthamoeba sp. UWC8]
MKIILFSNADWHFVAHLMPIALAAKEKGYDIKVITCVNEHGEEIKKQGLELFPINLERFGLNIFKELKIIFQLIAVYRKEKPDIAQHFGIKPILYGSIAAIFNKVPKVINTFLGMGFVFISDKLWVKAIRVVFTNLLKLFMLKQNSIIIVQNKDDKELLLKENIAKPAQIFAQCSVGIDLKNFLPLSEPNGKPVFALMARMILDKGIAEFAAAAEIINNKGLEAEFWLVGAPDPDNSRSVTEYQLREWEDKKIIKWLGFQSNIKTIWEKAHVAVLPSYREGLSRSLLEAAALGRALITTDAPGCRELVEDGINGLLVKVRDADSLAEAIEKLIVDNQLRTSLALKARETVVRDYSEEVIVKRMLKFYN